MGYSFAWILSHLSQSYASASYISASNVDGPYGFNSILSASYAITAAYALNGGGTGNPGGPLTSVQFNDNNTFNGSSKFTYEPVSSSLVLTGSLYLQGSGSPILTISGSSGGILSVVEDNSSNIFSISSGSIAILSVQEPSIVAITGSVTVSGSVSASLGPRTVGFYGTSSWSVSTSYAVTAAYAMNAGGSTAGNPAPSDTYVQYNTGGSFGASANFTYNYLTSSLSLTGSLLVDASNTSGGISLTGPVAITGSLDVTGSAIYFRSGSLPNLGQTSILVYDTGSGQVSYTNVSALEAVVTQSFTNSNTWVFTHNLGYRPITIQVYDTNYEQVIPLSITLDSINQATIRYSYIASGYAVATLGGLTVNNVGAATTPGGSNTQIQYNNSGVFGGIPSLTYNGSSVTATSISATGSFTGSFTGSLYGTASWALNVPTTVVTQSFTNSNNWVFPHNLGKKSVVIQIYNANDEQIIPRSIHLDSDNQATIGFSYNESGFALATYGGSSVINNTGYTYAANIGDGSTSNIGVTHNLNTRDVLVQLYDTATYTTPATAPCSIIRTNVNYITCSFASPPSLNQYRVIITKV